MKNLILSGIVLGCGFFSTGCKVKYESTDETRRTQYVCNLLGKWKTCEANGADSQEILLEVNSSSVAQEVASGFTGSSTCEGVGSPLPTKTFNLVMGTLGASAVVFDGTDVTVTPTGGADYGCGPNTTSYFAVKFFEECTEFKSTEPACSPGLVSGSLGTSVYKRNQL